jgi:hypothetical protein
VAVLVVLVEEAVVAVIISNRFQMEAMEELTISQTEVLVSEVSEVTLVTRALRDVMEHQVLDRMQAALVEEVPEVVREVLMVLVEAGDAQVQANLPTAPMVVTVGTAEPVQLGALGRLAEVGLIAVTTHSLQEAVAAAVVVVLAAVVKAVLEAVAAVAALAMA